MLKATVETITPERAAELLARNPRNRSLKPTVVDRYSRDMAAGRWTLNGEPIILNGDGSLRNGQHRCAACVKAGVPFQTLVVTGVDDDAMPTIDTGVNRSLADYLGIAGNPNASIVSGVVNWAMRYDLMVASRFRQLPPARFTRFEQLRYVEEHDRLLAHVADVVLAVKPQLGAVGSPSIFGFVHFVGARDGGKPRSKADKFIAALADPAGLGPNESPLLLRGQLLRGAGAHRRPHPTIVAALSLKAMRYWLNDEELKILKWSRGGKKYKGESFPRLNRPEPVTED